jgi:hypothetical protein
LLFALVLFDFSSAFRFSFSLFFPSKKIFSDRLWEGGTRTLIQINDTSGNPFPTSVPNFPNPRRNN